MWNFHNPKIFNLTVLWRHKMSAYYFAAILVFVLGFLGFMLYKNKKNRSLGVLALIAFVILYWVLVTDVAPTEFKGKPIGSLKNETTYTMYSRTDIGNYAHLILRREKHEEFKLYRIPQWKFRNENREIISVLPERFKVKKGTIGSIEGADLYQKGKTLKVYFVIPVPEE
jgi:hypothetical protein